MCIWKYKLCHKWNQIAMPSGAKVLTAQLRDEIIVLWAIVDPDRALEQRKFAIVFTGEKVDLGNKHYIGTVQDGPMVYHVFEELS